MRERFKLIPAVYLLLRRNNEVLLSRRANTGYQDGKYSLVAGHLDGDELATSGMVREAFEEAGIVVRQEDMKFVHLAHRLNQNEKGQERLDIFFECWKWEGEIKNMEPEKCDELAWFKTEHLPVDTLPLIKLVINNVIKDIHYSEYVVEPI